MDSAPTDAQASQKPNLSTIPICRNPAKEAQSIPHHAPLTPDSPYLYAEDGDLCIENQAAIPLERCIITNLSAGKVCRIALRDPKKPETWWGKRPRLRVGLSESAARKIQHGNLTTWIVLGVGFTLFGIGSLGALTGFAFSLTMVCYTVGSFAALVSGIFRAAVSISASKVGRTFTRIHGVHPDFLSQFDQFENGVLVGRANQFPSSPAN